MNIKNYYCFYVLYVIFSINMTLDAKLEFINRDSSITLKPTSSRLKFSSINNVKGWKEESIILETGYDNSWLTTDIVFGDSTGDTDPPTHLLYNDSNAIVNLEITIIENSMAIVNNDSNINHNSQAIVTIDNDMTLVKLIAQNSAAIIGNSNALVTLDRELIENSNAIVNNSWAIADLNNQIDENSWAIQNLIEHGDAIELVAQNSNAIFSTSQSIVTLDRQVVENSNAIIQSSNAIVTLNNYIEQNSNFIEDNSWAILNLQNDVNENSMAIVNNDDQISENSSALISCCNNANDLITQNSMAIVTNDNNISTNATNINYNSQTIVTNRSDIDTNGINILYNSQAIVNLEVATFENSNAIVNLQEDIAENSNAIINNSNAIVTVDSFFDITYDLARQNSSSIINNSNSIFSNARDINYNSQAIVTNRSDIDRNVSDINYNSQAIVSLNDLTGALITENSNAIINLEEDVVENSNAIINNSNAIVTVDSFFDITYDLARQNSSSIINNSNSIFSNARDINYNSQAIVTIDNDMTLVKLIAQNSAAIIGNSNALVTLDREVIENSNAIVNNSWAIADLNNQIDENSWAIQNLIEHGEAIELVAQNSNAIFSTSQSIVTLDRQIVENSNAIIQSSNAIVALNDYINQNSNFIEDNSWAILNLQNDVNENSMAIVNNDEDISYNSSALITCCSSANDLITQNSNSIINNQENINENSQAIIYINDISTNLSVQNSNAIVNNSSFIYQELVIQNSDAIINIGSSPLVNGPLVSNITINKSTFINPDERIYVADNITINGQGSVLYFAGKEKPVGPQFVVAPNKTVTLKNIKLVGIVSDTFLMENNNSTITIDQNVTWELNDNLTFTRGNFQINGSNIWNIQGIGGQKLLKFAPFSFENIPMINLGLSTLSLQNIELTGLEYFSYQTFGNITGALGLTGNTAVNVKTSNNIPFYIESLDNTFRLLENNLTFNGLLNYSDNGDNVLHFDFVLQSPIESFDAKAQLQSGKVPVVNFATNFIYLTSTNGIARIIFDDAIVKVNNAADAFIVLENSYLGTNKLQVSGDPIWDASSDNAKNRFSVEAIELEAVGLTSDVIPEFGIPIIVDPGHHRSIINIGDIKAEKELLDILNKEDRPKSTIQLKKTKNKE